MYMIVQTSKNYKKKKNTFDLYIKNTLYIWILYVEVYKYSVSLAKK